MKNGTETVNNFLDRLEEGNEHLVEVAREMLDDGKKENITFALQKRVLQPEPLKPPVRAESPRRAHEFHSVASFVGYLAKNKTTNTVVLADVNGSRIEAVLDESVKNGFERISFKPQLHPLFVPWKAGIINKAVPVRDFAKFLQQNKRTVSDPDVSDLTMLFSQIRASQKITMHKGIGKHSINGLTCELNIVGESKSQELELPEVIKIDVPIYIDTPNCEIEIDILLGASDTEVFVSCSSSDLDVKRVGAFESMLVQVREIEDVVVGFGEIAMANWAYLNR